MTTNGQLSDTHGYHTKPTNSTCNMIFCFRLKANIVFGSAVKLLSMEIILIIIKTKNVCQNPCCVGSLLQYIFNMNSC